MADRKKLDLPIVEGIHILSLIGKGHCSRVFKGVILENKEYVAVKVIDKNDLTQVKVDIIISEIGIMKSLNHPHIVRMLDFKWDSKSVYIILEFCEGGNLYEFIKLKHRLSEKLCKRALQQLALGLSYLREKNICHMDLKPQNVLIKFNPFTIKIADFGLAQYVPEKYYLDSLRGSPLYMAPEILLTNRYNSNVDLWSVGVILYECLYGRAPLAGKSWQELMEAHKKKTPIKYPSTVPLSKDCKDLLEKLLTYSPEKRISYEEFFQHPFIDLDHAPTEENKKLAFKIINEAVKLDEKKDYISAFNKYCQALRYLVPQIETMSASEDRAYFQLKVLEYLTRAEELKSVLFNESHTKPQLRQINLVGLEEATSACTEKPNTESTILSSITVDSDLHTKTSDKIDLKSGGISSEESNARGDDRSLSAKNRASLSFASEQYFSPLSEGSLSTSENSHSTIDDSHTLKDVFTHSPKIQSALEIGYAGEMYMLQGDYDIAYTKYESALSILISEVKDFLPGYKRNLLLFQIKKWLAEAEGSKTLASAKNIQLDGNVKTGIEAMGTALQQDFNGTTHLNVIWLCLSCLSMLLAVLMMLPFNDISLNVLNLHEDMK